MSFGADLAVFFCCVDRTFGNMELPRGCGCTAIGLGAEISQFVDRSRGLGGRCGFFVMLLPVLGGEGEEGYIVRWEEAWVVEVLVL